MWQFLRLHMIFWACNHWCTVTLLPLQLIWWTRSDGFNINNFCYCKELFFISLHLLHVGFRIWVTYLNSTMLYWIVSAWYVYCYLAFLAILLRYRLPFKNFCANTGFSSNNFCFNTGFSIKQLCFVFLVNFNQTVCVLLLVSLPNDFCVNIRFSECLFDADFLVICCSAAFSF